MLAVMPYSLQILFAALFGLSLGSFATVLLDRVPRNESILGRSNCPHCKHTLHFYDLVPIASFLLLGGACRSCKRMISWRYPVIEAITALLAALLVAHFGPEEQWILPLLGIAVFAILLIAFYDFDTQRIPDVFIIVLFLSALLYRSVHATDVFGTGLHDAFLGLSLPFAFFGGLWVMSRGNWIGSGDVLLGASIGLLLGLKLTAIAILFAYIMGALAVAFLLSLRLVQRGATIAFGPFLASGALLALFTGDAFLRQYVRLFL
jgi:prepilin signal peptidase PulO-like enzyme (type II secretory pathway)